MLMPRTRFEVEEQTPYLQYLFVTCLLQDHRGRLASYRYISSFSKVNISYRFFSSLSACWNFFFGGETSLQTEEACTVKESKHTNTHTRARTHTHTHTNALQFHVYVNPFHTIGLFRYPLKTYKNYTFSDVFRGCKRDCWHEMGQSQEKYLVCLCKNVAE